MENIVKVVRIDVDNEVKSESDVGYMHVVGGTQDVPLTATLDDAGDVYSIDRNGFDFPVYSNNLTNYDLTTLVGNTSSQSFFGSRDSNALAFKNTVLNDGLYYSEAFYHVDDGGLIAAPAQIIKYIPDITNPVVIQKAFDDVIGHAIANKNNLMVVSASPLSIDGQGTVTSSDYSSMEVYFGTWDQTLNAGAGGWVDDNWNSSSNHIDIVLGSVHTFERMIVSDGKYLLVFKDTTTKHITIYTANVEGYVNSLDSWITYDLENADESIYDILFAYNSFDNSIYFGKWIIADNSFNVVKMKYIDNVQVYTTVYSKSFSGIDGKWYEYNASIQCNDGIVVLIFYGSYNLTAGGNPTFYNTYYCNDGINFELSNLNMDSMGDNSGGREIQSLETWIPPMTGICKVGEWFLSTIYDSGNIPVYMFASKDCVQWCLMFIGASEWSYSYGKIISGDSKNFMIVSEPTKHIAGIPAHLFNESECVGGDYLYLYLAHNGMFNNLLTSQSCVNVKSLGEFSCNLYDSSYNTGNYAGYEDMKYLTYWDATTNTCNVRSYNDRLNMFKVEGECTAAGFEWDAKSGACVDTYSADNK